MAKINDFTLKSDNIVKALLATDKSIERALEIIGAKAADYAAGLAPVDTGRLKNSLTHRVNMDEKAVYVGSNVEYAPFVEFGHLTSKGNKIDPQPYLKPAIEQHMDEFKEILSEELKLIDF